MSGAVGKRALVLGFAVGSMGQIAIAWLLTRPTVASVLLGARTVAQLCDNLAAATVDLTGQDLAELTTASAPGLPPYPYEMIDELCDIPPLEAARDSANVQVLDPTLL